MKKKDIFWGLLLVLAAIFIIVDRLGYFPQIGVVKIFITIVLIAIMLKSIIRVRFSGILFPIAFLCIIYAEQWNITALTPGPVLGTALLASIGLSMIFKKDDYWCHHAHWNHDHWRHSDWHNRDWRKDNSGENFEQVINEPDGNVVNCTVSFGSSMKYINTDNFEKANIRCSCGSMKVYFDKAVVSSGHAEIYLDISLSGVELYIPKTWNVVYDVNITLGGIDEKNRKTASDSPVVTIKGSISLSGVEIIYI